jgi:transcriptional regulator with XRE-family HTH domain
MTLKDYLDEQGKGALTRLAERLGTSKGYLVGIRDGDRMPSVSFAKKIEAATNGDVTAICLLGLDRRGKRKACAQ